MAVSSICDRMLCTGCGTCKQVCPKSAVSMRENEEGFLYPVIDRTCIECGLCLRKCPVNTDNEKKAAHFYMGWHKDKEVLKTSSSGGLFTSLSQYVFDRGGVVFGAVKNKDNRIVHTYAESMEELEPLKLSKYYQSDLGNSYSQVKSFLLQDTMVLFTGTACQIAGLKNYLGKEYEILLTMDVLCHGAASKKVVDAFIKSKEKQFKKHIIDYHFRVKEKERGWYNGGGTRMHLFFEDGTSVVEPGRYDTFFLGFNHNYFLRESCYRCRFCGTERISDFTLADYWRCDHKEISEEQLKLGVALILANSERSIDILDWISDSIVLYEIEATNAIAHNRALVGPQERPSIRDDFFHRLDSEDYDRIIHSQFRNLFRKRKVKLFLHHFMPSALYNRCFHD